MTSPSDNSRQYPAEKKLLEDELKFKAKLLESLERELATIWDCNVISHYNPRQAKLISAH